MAASRPVLLSRRNAGALRSGSIRSSCILACIAAVALFAGSLNSAGGVQPQPLAAAKFNLQKKLPKSVKKFLAGSPRPRTKVLVQAGDYELAMILNRGHILPKPTFRRIPPPPVAMKSTGASLAGDREALRGFPFTTHNAGSVDIAFPRIEGHLGISMEDPPATAMVDSDEGKQGVTVSYGQRVPAVGLVNVRGSTSGDWGASLEREIEDLGDLKASIDGQLDWNVDLTSVYNEFKGIVPTVSYGATQDGMRATAKFDGDLPKNTHVSYEVSNLAGKYSPTDFLHDCRVVIASAGPATKKEPEPFARHSLEAHGRYDRRLPEQPMRTDLTYSLKLGRASMDASIDFEHYRLQCRVPHAEASYAVSRSNPSLIPAEASLQLGKVLAVARKDPDGEPRFRLSFAR